MRLIDITGQTFGRLKVICKAPEPCMWECLCSCGETVFTTGTNLRLGNTTSCGCLHKEKLAAYNHATKSLDPWLADMKLYKRKVSYRRGRAKLGSNQFKKVKGRPVSDHPSFRWGLDLEVYVQLVTTPCYYCGRPPHQKPQGALMRTLGLRRNGIDRVDNTKGYEPGNCVSCCAFCNREKRAQTQEDFIENTRRRYEHMVATGLITK